MATTSHSPRSVKSLRRFVTVVACELRFTQRDLEKFGEETVGLGVDVAWNILAGKARENGGLVLPLHGSSAEVVFGYPNPDADHAARAVQCARQFVDAAAAEGNQQGWIPSFAVGIHSADCLILEQGHRSSRSISISGSAPDCAALLSHIPRNGEILLTESTLKTFASDLPAGLETLQVQFEEEPELDGLNWESVVFLGLPDHLRREAVLAGHGVTDNPGEAEYFFRYLFSIKVISTRATLNVLSLQAVEQAPSFLLQAPSGASDDEMSRLGSYTLVKRLGKGGTGQVWLARDFHGNLVALKSLQEAFAGDQRLIGRLQREARAMASLPHPNICQVYEVGETDGLHFIAMEYVSGITLADLLWSGSGASASPATIPEIIQWIQKWQQSHEGTELSGHPRHLPFPETLRMFCKVCEAVAFAHEHGILHRDLKPGNILLRENGEPVVSDFGLAKLESADTENSLSLHGEILGTLEYMAPEQAHDSKNVDERADIYGLGSILYLLLSGRPHFSPGGDILKDAARLQTHEPKPVRSLVGNMHPDIATIAEKCLRPHRHDRYQSARMLRDDLERFLLGQPILARPPSPLRLAKAWTLKHQSMVGTVATALFVMLLFAIYSFAQINRKRIEAEAALVTAKTAKDLAEENEQRAIAAMQKSEQARIRAENAESENQRISSNLAQERAKSSRLEKQQQMMQKAPGLVEAEGIAGDDLRDPPEPQRKSAPAETGLYYQFSYSRELVHELSAHIRELDNLMNWSPQAAGTSPIDSQNLRPRMVEIYQRILCQSKLLLSVSSNNPEALVLLAKLSAIHTKVGEPEKLLKSAISQITTPSVKAAAQELLLRISESGSKQITAEMLKESTPSSTDYQIAAIADAISRYPKTFENLSLSPDFLMRFVSRQAEKTAFDQEPVHVALTTDIGNAGAIVAPGANDRNIALIAEFARSVSPCPSVDLSYSPTTLIPWELAASCREVTARRSAATGFSGALPSPILHLKKLDLANSAFREPATMPPPLTVESLNINNCPVPDGGFVFGFHELRELYALAVPFQSLDKAAQLKNLKILRFSPGLVVDHKSIEVLRNMKSLTHIGTNRDKALLPVAAFWLLHDAGYFESGDDRNWSGNMPEIGSALVESRPGKTAVLSSPAVSPAPSPSPDQKVNDQGWWPLHLLAPQTPAPKRTPGFIPPTLMAPEVSDIITRMNALFASFPRSAPADQILAQLRPLIGSFGARLNLMNSRNVKDPAYVLLCAKYESLLMDGARVSDLLQHAGKLAAESSASGLAEECRTLQATLQETDNGGALITTFGLRRTGTPDNIRLAALYENIGNLARDCEKSTGHPFDPKLLHTQEPPSSR